MNRLRRWQTWYAFISHCTSHRLWVAFPPASHTPSCTPFRHLHLPLPALCTILTLHWAFLFLPPTSAPPSFGMRGCATAWRGGRAETQPPYLSNTRVACSTNSRARTQTPAVRLYAVLNSLHALLPPATYAIERSLDPQASVHGAPFPSTGAEAAGHLGGDTPGGHGPAATPVPRRRWRTAPAFAKQLLF